MTASIMIAPATQISLKDVLFATDFSAASEHALPYLRAIAKPFNSAVHLCHIEAPIPPTASFAAPQIYEATGKLTAEHLTALLNAPLLKGLNLNLALGSGRIKDELLQIIRERHIDLVIAGTHGRAGFRKFLLGSVVEEIIRVASCPVLIVGPSTPSRRDAPFERILFPTNLTDSSDKILPYLLLFAKQFAAKLTVLHVTPQGEPVTAADQSIPHSMEQALRESLEPTLAGFRPEFLVEKGDPANVILRVSRERHIDLIVMGIENQFSPGAQLRSSTAYRIIAGAECPALTLRQEQK
jgi:nucleotide-binding universal stress UspA family protein